jgi:outer membrane protein assembly factor BamA
VILRQELTVAPGDPVDRQRIEASRQAIMNLGLFKRVRARVEPLDEASPDQQVVVFDVSEKWYILPLPKADQDADGDYSYGFELTWDNFLGYNQRLELLHETTERDDGNKEVKREFAYDIPRIPRTDLGLSAALRRVDSVQEEADAVLGDGVYDLQRDSFGWAVSRWLTRSGPSRGWRGSVGNDIFKENYSYRQGVAGLLVDRKIVETWFGATFHDVYEFPYHREGREYGWTLALSAQDFGSDDGYQRLDLFHRAYFHPVAWNDDNLNTQLRLGYARGYDEGVYAYRIGSAKTLRGFDRDDHEGDVLVLLNLEYMKPILSRRSLRGVIFADVGNVYEEGAPDLTDLELGGGLGLRWKVRSLVRTDLRVDVGWGLGEADYEVYVGTKQTF